MKFTSLFIIFFTIIICNANADINAAREAFRSKDYDAGIAEFTRLANDGNRDAMFSLGQIYGQGQVVEKDLILAFKWSKKAADLGHMIANYTVGHAYLAGLGIEKDFDLANYYMEKSATEGFINAYTGLIQIAMSQNPTKYRDVRKWLEIAIEKNDENIRFRMMLAELYRTGQGGEVNIPGAIELFKNGIAGGNPIITYQLGVTLSNEATPILNDLPEALAMYYISDINGHKPEGNERQTTENRATKSQVNEAYKKLSVYYETTRKPVQWKLKPRKNSV